MQQKYPTVATVKISIYDEIYQALHAARRPELMTKEQTS